MAFLTFLTLAFLHLSVEPVNYWVLHGLTVAFLAMTVGRLACIAQFIGTGDDPREEKERGLLPERLRASRAQRCFTAADLSITESARGCIAAYFLSLTAINPGAQLSQDGILWIIGMVFALALASIFLAAVLLRMAMLSVQVFGKVGFYDPNEKVVELANLDEGQRRALRRLSFYRRLGTHAGLVLIPCLLLFPAAADLGLHEVQEIGFQYVLPGTISLFCLCIFLRFMTIALCFSRVSLQHIFVFNLLIGLGVALTITLDDFMKLPPLIFSLALFVHALLFVAIQDPEGEHYVPEFLKARLRDQKREARLRARLQRQAAAGGAKPGS